MRRWAVLFVQGSASLGSEEPPKIMHNDFVEYKKEIHTHSSEVLLASFSRENSLDL